MGDDLIFAQKFTRTAADGLSLLVEMDDPRAAGDSAVVIDMMTTVQRGAKRLRARHIYSGAQGVLSALHHETDTVLHSRIENLGFLVTEYARGLDELLETPDSERPETREDAWNAARETLNELLPVASAEDADILSRLMRAPVTRDAVHPEEATPISSAEPFASLEFAAPFEVIPFQQTKPTPDTEIAAREEPAAESTPNVLPSRHAEAEDLVQVPLDSMMRDVIAEALSVARSIGRTISLSYDMGDKTLSSAEAENLRGRLGQALSQIIRESLTDGRVGHIDINLAGEQLHILAGTTAVRVALAPKTAAETDTLPSEKRRITPETEQGLRAQLNALMDPISLHETAS